MIWRGIDLTAVDPDIPVAIGGAIDAETVFEAAKHGVILVPTDHRPVRELNRVKYAAAVESGRVVQFAGASDPYSCIWWAPDPRQVLSTDVPRLARSVRTDTRRFSIITTVNSAFDETMDACIAAHWPTWITLAARDAYKELRTEGFAHSIEVWHGDDLVGGSFGIGFGTSFSLDSAFFRMRNMSKVACVDMATRLSGVDSVPYVDLQFSGPLTEAVKSIQTDRRTFLENLHHQDETPLTFDTQALPASRLP